MQQLNLLLTTQILVKPLPTQQNPLRPQQTPLRPQPSPQRNLPTLNQILSPKRVKKRRTKKRKKNRTRMTELMERNLRNRYRMMVRKRKVKSRSSHIRLSKNSLLSLLLI